MNDKPIVLPHKNILEFCFTALPAA